jgi:hypothetical protein
VIMILNVNSLSIQHAHSACCAAGCSEDGGVFTALVPSAPSASTREKRLHQIKVGGGGELLEWN